MAETNGFAISHLIINRAEVVAGGCSACGKDFGSGHNGDRALSASIGGDHTTYMFCASCGDFIMGRVLSDAVRERYVWDWAIPLRGTVMAAPLGAENSAHLNGH